MTRIRYAALDRTPVFLSYRAVTYRSEADLIGNSEKIKSRKGTTQGDPLTTSMYAVATIPLIFMLKEFTKQVWYADDAAAIGTIQQVHAWLNQLLTRTRIRLPPQRPEDMADYQTSTPP